MSHDVLHTGANPEIIHSLTKRAYEDLFHPKVVNRERVTLEEAGVILAAFNQSNKLTGYYELTPADMFQPTFVMRGVRTEYPYGPRAMVEMGELALADLEGRQSNHEKTLKSGIEKIVTTMRRQIL